MGKKIRLEREGKVEIIDDVISVETEIIGEDDPFTRRQVAYSLVTPLIRFKIIYREYRLGLSFETTVEFYARSITITEI